MTLEEIKKRGKREIEAIQAFGDHLTEVTGVRPERIEIRYPNGLICKTVVNIKEVVEETKEVKRQITEDAIKYGESEETIRDWWKDAMKEEDEDEDEEEVRVREELLREMLGAVIGIMDAKEEGEEEEEDEKAKEKGFYRYIAMDYEDLENRENLLLLLKRDFPEDSIKELEKIAKGIEEVWKEEEDKEEEKEEEIREMEEAAFGAFGEVLEIIRGVKPDRINVRYPTGDIMEGIRRQ